MSNFRYSEGCCLRAPAGSHTHFASDLPPPLQAKIAGVDRDRPILHERNTYFPISFSRDDLSLAFKAINRMQGWTLEARTEGLSYVGEHDNGSYKIRIALHHNNLSPDLITAYPVSRIDRQSHGDFLRLGCNNDQGPGGPKLPKLTGVQVAMVNPKQRIKKVAELFIAVSNNVKIFGCCGCDDFDERNACNVTNYHDNDCQINQVHEGMIFPLSIKCNNEEPYRSWRGSSIDTGAPWHFVIDPHVSMSLLLLCCRSYESYVKRHTIPWDTQRAKDLVRWAEEARLYCIKLREKNRMLTEAGNRISKTGKKRQASDSEVVEVIDIGRSPEEEFMVLSPSRRIGYKSRGYLFVDGGPRFVDPDDCLLKELKELASVVKDSNQEETNMERAIDAADLAEEEWEWQRRWF